MWVTGGDSYYHPVSPCITLYHPVSPCSSVVLPCTTSFYLLQRSTEWFRAVQKSDLYSALRIVLFVHFWVTGGDSYYYNYALPPCITLYHLVSPCSSVLLPPSTWYRQVQSGSEHESEERSVQWAVYSAVVHFCVSNRWWLVLPPCITLYHPVSPCITL